MTIFNKKHYLFLLLLALSANSICAESTILNTFSSFAQGTIGGATPLVGGKLARWFAKGKSKESQRAIFYGYQTAAQTERVIFGIGALATTLLAAITSISRYSIESDKKLNLPRFWLKTTALLLGLVAQKTYVMSGVTKALAPAFTEDK
jgi:hypothetical protein